MAVTKSSDTHAAVSSRFVDVMGHSTRGEGQGLVGRSRSAELVAHEASAYVGKWVSTRGGRVVASADTYQELMADPRRERLDGAVLVPPLANTYF